MSWRQWKKTRRPPTQRDREIRALRLKQCSKTLNVSDKPGRTCGFGQIPLLTALCRFFVPLPQFFVNIESFCRSVSGVPSQLFEFASSVQPRMGGWSGLPSMGPYTTLPNLFTYPNLSSSVQNRETSDSARNKPSLSDVKNPGAYL
jgi:hypothetical protein